MLQAYGDVEKKAGLLLSRFAASPYFFSGILTYSICHGSFSIVAGAGAQRKFAQYRMDALGTRVAARAQTRDELAATQSKGNCSKNRNVPSCRQLRSNVAIIRTRGLARAQQSSDFYPPET
jgi:hypothetical protein